MTVTICWSALKLFQGTKVADDRFPKYLAELFLEETLMSHGLSENLIKVYCYEMKKIIDNAATVSIYIYIYIYMFFAVFWQTISVYSINIVGDCLWNALILDLFVLQ